jgi:ferredoxin
VPGSLRSGHTGGTSAGARSGTLGAEMPDGIRFIGPEPDAVAAWFPRDHPTDEDLSACVACGLCLPHCPTYRLTGEESASPRGRIAAMRAVAEGVAGVDQTFISFMDLCLACRACEEVCPSHVPFGRLMEGPWLFSRVACRTVGSTRRTSPRSACFRGTGGAWWCRRASGAAARSQHTTEGWRRRACSPRGTREPSMGSTWYSSTRRAAART